MWDICLFIYDNVNIQEENKPLAIVINSTQREIPGRLFNYIVNTTKISQIGVSFENENFQNVTQISRGQ